MQAIDHTEQETSRPDPRPRTFILTAIALLLLLALTAGLSWVDLGHFNTPVALLIAAAKALLILFIFMEAGFSKKLIWLYAAIGFVWLHERFMPYWLSRRAAVNPLAAELLAVYVRYATTLRAGQKGSRR